MKFCMKTVSKPLIAECVPKRRSVVRLRLLKNKKNDIWSVIKKTRYQIDNKKIKKAKSNKFINIENN